MTDPKHPLTDDICADILPKRSFGLCNLSETHLNTRVLGEVRHCNDMRAAADWQLEQVIKFIAKEDTEYADCIKKAMRPQQQKES